MQPVLDAAYARCKSIGQELQKKFKAEFAAIVYRDSFDTKASAAEDSTSRIDFTANLGAIQKFLAGQEAKGGGNAEDWVSAYTSVQSLSWGKDSPDTARLVVHITDAPAHGPLWGSAHEAKLFAKCRISPETKKWGPEIDALLLARRSGDADSLRRVKHALVESEKLDQLMPKIARMNIKIRGIALSDANIFTDAVVGDAPHITGSINGNPAKSFDRASLFFAQVKTTASVKYQQFGNIGERLQQEFYSFFVAAAEEVAAPRT
jgi:hypothetical protein